jgi:hypothetical protein
MTPDVNSTHLSRQVWQAVSEHVLRSVSGLDFCSERSLTENLRPVYAVDEDEFQYGRQIWHFEVLGITPSGRRQTIYGMIEFSIQYGFLEMRQSVFFEQAIDREHYFAQLTRPRQEDPMERLSTRFWVWAAWVSVALLSAGWLAALVRHLTTSLTDSAS